MNAVERISLMILCKVCLGLDFEERMACEACGGTGVDPESFRCDCEDGETERAADEASAPWPVVQVG
jgi:hypothetical protein